MLTFVVGESEFPCGSSAARCSAPRAASGAVVLILQAGDIFAGVVAPAEAERRAGRYGRVIAQCHFVLSHLLKGEGDLALQVRGERITELLVLLVVRFLLRTYFGSGSSVVSNRAASAAKL